MSSETPAETNSTSSSSNRLQAVNYANVIAYIVNLAVVWGAPKAGLPDNATLSEKYQTLVTPAGYAFAIWGIIFTAELIWTIAQCLPSYRSTVLVTKGVGYYFVWACLAQAIWTVAFGLEKIPLSLLCMVLILIPLLIILNNISRLDAESIGRYWLLKFPFEIHCAWLMAATLVNTNVVFVAVQASSTVQTVAGWTSLVAVILIGIYYTMQRKWVVPSVLAWATAAIANQLANPKDLIVETFAASTIQQTKIVSWCVAAILLLAMLAKIVHDRFFKKSGEEVTTADGYSAM
ncbi:MAG: hypothetical protein SGILL_008413 [Bacillariaceae sp.]